MIKPFLGIVIFLLTMQTVPGFVGFASATVKNQSKYVTLKFEELNHLRSFNTNFMLGNKLSRSLKNYEIITVKDEVLAKLDTLIDQAKVVLDMFPEGLHITIVLLPSRADIGKMYQMKYGQQADHIAYYSLSEDTIYISVADTTLQVLAHEIGHAIVDHYFKVRPPYKIHELLAQFTEQHIIDD